MNLTAVLHATAMLLLGVGIFVPGQTLTVGLIAVAVGLFGAGIVVARRSDDADHATSASD